jgi:hypothetical protein
MTVASAPGTSSPITLGSATTGYQSFGAGYNNTNATVDILITEGANWEICRNCTYTHSGTTVTRTTPEASSAGGAAVSFGSNAIVSVIATAATGNNWGLHEVQSNADAAVTGVVGTMHILDIGPFTADRDFTLPATCAVGDRVGVFIKTGDPSFELLLKPASGDTINGGSVGAEWSRLFITGECVIFRCITANADWIVEYDGRIPSAVSMTAASAQTGIAASTWTTLTEGATGSWGTPINVGNLADTGNDAVIARRKGNYVLNVVATLVLMTDQRSILLGFQLNGSGNPRRVCRLATSTAASTTTGGSGSVSLSLQAGDSVRAQILHTDTANRDTEYIANESLTTVEMRELLS